MDDQALVQRLHACGVIAGPDHFVVGDGYGNPDCHAGMFVVEESLEQNEELLQILIDRLWSQISVAARSVVSSQSTTRMENR